MKHSTDLKISSKQAEEVLETWLGQTVCCQRIERLLGGEIHSVFALEFDSDPFNAVIKLRIPEDESFEAERERLNYLGKKGVRVPQVFGVGAPNEQNPFSYILLERLPGIPLEAAELTAEERIDLEKLLAEEVLKLHSNTRDTFGEICGRLATTQWSDIVVPRLIDMRDEMQGMLPADVLAQIDTAVDAAEDIFAESQSVPTLIHGDLWAGNVMVDRTTGRWRYSGFIDPGTQYADVEHELAYLQCFDTVGQSFFDVYTEHTPMRPGFELRKLYYWLNTQMIHVWLFDTEEYKNNTARVAGEIMTELSKRKEPTEKFISEQIKPVVGTYDTSAMSIGEPGFPARFTWRKKEYVLNEVLEKWKDTSNCRHGGTEKYVRKHWYRIRTACGVIMKIYFERQVKPGTSQKRRWWLNTIQGKTRRDVN